MQEKPAMSDNENFAGLRSNDDDEEAEAKGVDETVEMEEEGLADETTKFGVASCCFTSMQATWNKSAFDS